MGPNQTSGMTIHFVMGPRTHMHYIWFLWDPGQSWCFPNFIVHPDHLRIVLKWWVWVRRSGLRPKSLHFHQGSRCYQCCWSLDPSLRREVLEYPNEEFRYEKIQGIKRKHLLQLNWPYLWEGWGSKVPRATILHSQTQPGYQSSSQSHGWLPRSSLLCSAHQGTKESNRDWWSQKWPSLLLS